LPIFDCRIDAARGGKVNESSGQETPTLTAGKAEASAKAGVYEQPIMSELDQVKELATFGSPDAEIAAVVGCRAKWLERRYGKIIRQARAAGAADLRKLQWDKARDGNVPMLIWLGRQMLGQSPQAIAGADAAPPARVVLDLSQDP
jgi:hypothetical protein